MYYLEQFALFWYRFLIGEDWVGAAIVMVGLILTYALLKANLDIYWFLPVVVMFSISLSLFRQSHPVPNKRLCPALSRRDPDDPLCLGTDSSHRSKRLNQKVWWVCCSRLLIYGNKVFNFFEYLWSNAGDSI